MAYTKQNFSDGNPLYADQLDHIEQGIVDAEGQIPKKTSDLVNDSGYITDYSESDPTVPGWAKQSKKPGYTAAEVGADPAGTAVDAVADHNVSENAHNDIRLELQSLATKLNNFLDSDDTTLDELSELISAIQANAGTISQLTSGKVNVADIVNNLTTNVTNKPLSAAQGVALKKLIDTLNTSLANYQPKGDYALKSEIPSVPVQSVNGKTGAVKLSASDVGALPSTTTIPNKTSQLTNDSGFISGYTETDPTVPSWAKQSKKPGYTAAEVGADPAGTAAAAVSAHNADLSAHADLLAGKADVLNASVTPELEITERKLPYVTGGNKVGFYDNSNGQYGRIIASGLKSITVYAYQWRSDYGYYMIVFSDAAGIVVSKHAPAKAEAYSTMTVDVPAGAMYAYITGKTGGAITVTATKRVDIGTLNDDKANRIARWVTPPMDRKEGVIISANGTGETAQSGGMIVTVDVSKYKRVIATGYQYSITYGFDVVCFYNASGGLISSHQGATEQSAATLELDVPENAVTMKMTALINASSTGVLCYQVFDVEDVYDAVRPQGKKLITLGDSITALGMGKTGWVKYFIEKTGCELVANVAVNSAVLSDYSGTNYDGNPSSGTQTNNVLGNQVQKIINSGYDAPDIIMIAIGTNGGINITKDQIKAAYYGSNNALIPLENVDRTTNAGAYRWCLEKLHATYPNAIIFWCTPIMGYQATRSAENAVAYAESLRIATEYSGQIMIDTIRCGINGVNEVSSANGQYLVDGLHPNANGAKKIGYYNAAKVMPYLEMVFDLN